MFACILGGRECFSPGAAADIKRLPWRQCLKLKVRYQDLDDGISLLNSRMSPWQGILDPATLLPVESRTPVHARGDLYLLSWYHSLHLLACSLSTPLSVQYSATNTSLNERTNAETESLCHRDSRHRLSRKVVQNMLLLEPESRQHIGISNRGGK